MSRYYSYLNTAKTILQEYTGEEPFASFLKKYFAADKKYGSKDRKQISHLCYCFFRMGKMNMDLPLEERLLMGLFFCSEKPDEMLESLKPGWNEKVSKSLEEKFSIFNVQYSILNVFPWGEALTEGIDQEKFCESFFVQPDLFLRLRPGHEQSVKNKLGNAGINFEMIGDSCLCLPNATKIETVIALNREAVVQDYSSQRVGEFCLSASTGLPGRVWDCCAASGGKSIMLYDLYPGIDLTVSDLRESILINLKRRFKEAGISRYKSLVADLTLPHFEFPYSDFGFVVADVPCTGSGTWSRTPEQLYYFNTEKIDEYAARQKKIVSNIIPRLRPGGFLLYITCSGFKKENEEIVATLEQQHGLNLVEAKLLKGYDKRADTMFVALLKKPA